MSLKLILGPSGSGKSSALFETALSEAEKDPGRQYLVLVPEQFTMQTQQQLCSLSSTGGVLNIDILSFSRLAVRIFEETGVRKKTLLRETGKTLLLRLIADREASGLSLLSEAVDRPGALSELKSILSEMDQYEITDDDMAVMIGSCEGRPALREKLRQLQLLRTEYREFQEEHGLQTVETIPQALCMRIPHSKMLEGSHIYLDGYTGFTPAQLDVLSELMRKAASVTVAVTIDPGADLTGRISEDDLFALSKRTIQALLRIAAGTKTPVEMPRILGTAAEGGKCRFSEDSEIGYLERNLFRPGKRKAMPERGKTGEVRILSCADPAREARAAAAIIRSLTRHADPDEEEADPDHRDQGQMHQAARLRYRDIAVIVGSLPVYSEYLRRVFTQAKIPFFLDRSVPVTLNPAFEFVKDAFAILDGSFSYESMMAFFRTGFVLEDRRSLDLLENYILAAGIRGRRRWSEPWARPAEGFPEEALAGLEDTRAGFMKKFEPFAEVCRHSSAKLRDYARALWELIDAFKVQQKLSDLASRREEAGDAAGAGTYRHAASVIASVLDEAVSLLGDETVRRTQFEQILQAGLSEAKIGIIPPGTDEIHIGDLTRSRITDVKAVLFLGMNDDYIPARKGSAGILTNMERDFLEEKNFHLTPTEKEDARIQKFYLYLMLSKPSDLLVLSHARMGQDNKPMRPAAVLRQIEALLPLAVEEEGIPGGIASEIYLPEETGRALAHRISESRSWSPGEREKRLPELKELLLAAKEHAPEMTYDLLKSLMPKQLPRLSQEAAGRLYGDVLEGSVSRLEKFAQCPFQQYAVYGLGLAERARFEVQPADVGSVMHRAMQLLAERVRDSREYTWKTLPGDILNVWSEDSLKEAALEKSGGKFSDTFRSAGQYRRLLGIFRHSAHVLQVQLAAGDFQPAFFEVSFDSENQMTARPLLFGDGKSMQLRGRIDRIDESADTKNGKVYVKVIDYKTGNTSFDLKDVYMGTELQLVVYMDSAIALERQRHRGESVVCAGILYYPIADPVLDAGAADKDDDEIESERRKKVRPNGLVLNDPEVLRRLSEDPDMLPEVAPAKLRKDGSVSDLSSAADEQQFRLLSEFSRVRMKEAGERILSGEIEPSPLWENEKQNACTFCAMKEVCGFHMHDPVLKSREPVRGSKDQIWEKIRAETDGKEKKGSGDRSGKV